MRNFLRRYKLVIIALLLLGLGFSLGISFASSSNRLSSKTSLSSTSPRVINNDQIGSTTTVVDLEPFWKVWNLLEERYVPTKVGTTTVVTDQDKIWGAIKGLTDSLDDPYTVFMPPQDSKDFLSDLSGNFEGVGMEIGIKEGSLSVVAPLKGSPAEAAGIKAGDKIITIDAQPASNLSVDKAVKLIRGPKDTIVKLGVIRDGDAKPLEFSVVRDVINLPSVETELKDDVFIIRLFNFYGSSRSQFGEALKEFIQAKKRNLIIDLRGNPGGYLDVSVDIASWFLPLGKVIVRENFGENSDLPEKVYRSKGNNLFNDNLRLIVLVDEGSASASEILAGALQENGKAKLLGTKTFGKGSVQEVLSITDDTSLKITIARWFTPNGKSISENGLAPDFLVEVTDEDIKNDRDPQLDRALEVIKSL